MNSAIVIRDQQQTQSQHNVALHGEETNGQFSLRVQHVESGYGTPLHAHREQSETFHVVRGNFTFQVGDEQIVGKPGMTVHIPAGIPHCFLFEADWEAQTGELISILTPGIHDGFIRDVPAAQDAGVPMETLTEMANDNGVDILGPKLTSITE